ncbi:MAG: type I-U CRISPR-associated helicase/endonuclease Cas3 [Synechococcus sp. SB0662_bin_45]|nr:type I-U CRISPR-associated helicase/endonuclease Cas3 [Synechococcus sp. SB0668_bin_13]MYE21999.1 type I-U CRISPR-associated helicase/endonuclease Cas3 [Synechococcus sp. SB0662_bin_45]
MTAPLPTFPEFYRAVNGRDPFPWQSRLANRLSTAGTWPEEIGVPTGMGKTACLEIAVWWLASQADRVPEERTAPTRIWWVVNRRLLVDSTAEQARALAEKLVASQRSSGLEGNGKPDSDALALVAERLCPLSAGRGEPPLKVISLRGGLASRTPTDPSCPTVILCTLPMYGSRLLFRGYGSSLRAVDAAMAGTDSLVLLDEAHLARHLRSLVVALGECMTGAQPLLNNQRSTATVVTLTATGDPDPASSRSRFDLDDDDKRHGVIQKRLDATKRLELIEAEGDIARHLAEGTIRLMEEADRPASFLVFANTPRTAREVFNRVKKETRKKAPEPDLQLLTGLTREREAERIRKHILDREQGMAATRSATTPRERHLVVVATQTLEVGADLDAEYLITEACGVRALTQRLGRLNRLGNHNHARALYIHVPPERRHGGKWPVYDKEPEDVLQRLKDAQKQADEDQTVNLSPRRVAEVLGPPGDDPGRAPEVLPGILWEWVKTTTPPEGEAPVEPYFSGIASPQYTVSVIWRVHVPEPGRRLWPRAKDREAVDIARHEFQAVLTDDEPIHRLGSDGVTVETIGKADLRSGDRVVLPTDRGLLDEFGWNTDAPGPVMDISLAGQGLPLDPTAIKRLCAIDLTSEIKKALGTEDDETDELDEAEQDQAIITILEVIRAVETPQGWDPTEWSNFTDSLEPSVVESRREVPRLRVRSPQPEGDTPIDDFDENSLVESVSASNRELATLAGHGQAVGGQSQMVAERVGLPMGLCKVVERAARLHDMGKADRRFQLWLDPEDKNGVAMAKSDEPRRKWETMRVQSGWPRGGRHEDLSARLVLAWLQQQPDWGTPIERDLLVHLVISHHGKGRPLVPPAADGTGEHVRGVIDGVAVEASADLARIDWEQPARFRRLNDHFGPWGLALLEAIVIRSDHAVSASMSGVRTSWK